MTSFLLSSLLSFSVFADYETAVSALVDDDPVVFMEAVQKLRIDEINQSNRELYGETLLITAVRLHRDYAVRHLLTLNQICLECRDEYRNTALLEAIHQKNLFATKALIHRKADVNVQEENLVTPLMRSAQLGFREAFDLLAMHPEINPDLTDVLGNSVVHYLLSLGDDVGGMAQTSVDVELLEGNQAGELEIVIEVEQGADSWSALLEELVRSKDAQRLQEGLETRKNLDQSRMAMLKFLMEQAYDGDDEEDLRRRKRQALQVLNDEDYSPLELAAESGIDGAIPFLLEFGVELPAKDSAEAHFLLLLAINSGQASPVRYLVQEKEFEVNFNFKELDHLSPLHLATMRCWDRESFDILIQAKADIENRCGQGFTPLLRASAMGNFVAISCLLENQANFLEKNNEMAFSALSLVALETDCVQSADRLVKAGAVLGHRDADGDNLLHLSLYRLLGSPIEGMELVAYLIRRSPELLDQKNREGLSPRMLARELPVDLWEKWQSLLPEAKKAEFN
jgi:ankyrin repeat protein